LHSALSEREVIDGIEIRTYSKPIVHNDEDVKIVEDWGTYVVLKTATDHPLSRLLFTSLEMGCYVMGEHAPFDSFTSPNKKGFLDKYRTLYYEPDNITKDLLGCFFDW
jgi:hypothetical protein